VLKAVLDSSTLVSAFLTPRGISGQVLDAARARAFALSLSREILDEVAASLLRKTKLRARYGYGAEELGRFSDGLLGFAQLVADLPSGRFVPGDPKDDMVVATAVAADADYLVTGDRRHILPIGSHGRTRIVTARQFLELL
jgi:uncharacterized protein